MKVEVFLYGHSGLVGWIMLDLWGNYAVNMPAGSTALVNCTKVYIQLIILIWSLSTSLGQL